MPSSRPDKCGARKTGSTRESRYFAQLGLDFTRLPEYSNLSRKENEPMNNELFEALENKVSDLLEKYMALKTENTRLMEENQRLQSDREGFKSRVDAILGKLEGV